MNPLLERQLASDRFGLSQQPSLSAEQLADGAQQARLGRWLLERQQRAAPQPAVSPEQAIALQQALARDLPEAYHWLIQLNPSELATVMNDVVAFRQEFTAIHGEISTGGRVYRHFRLELEQASDELNEAAYQRVVVLEALLKGDITRGTLPF